MVPVTKMCPQFHLAYKTRPDWSFVKGRKLPEGKGDTIYKALMSDGQLLALKEVEIVNSPEELKFALELLKEINLLSENGHKNIVRYKHGGIYIADTDEEDRKGAAYVQIFLEFFHHDTLEELYDDFQGKISEQQIGRYTRHILEGIAYLHDVNIIHRDIRCRNIWVNDEGVCKLTNFGKAKELKQRPGDETQGTTSTVGSPHWMAPEMVAVDPERSSGYKYPVDIWSLGCTVLEMLTYGKPYGNLKDAEVITKLRQKQAPPIPETLDLDPITTNFLQKCLQIDPDDRPTATDLLCDPFVNFPWLDSENRKSNDQSMRSRHEQSSRQEDHESEVDNVSTGQEMSVENLCKRISMELERNRGDHEYLFMISTDWLEKWQSGDDMKVYILLWGAGYMKTFDTDTYSCFEKVLDCSIEEHNPYACSDVQSRRIKEEDAHGEDRYPTTGEDSSSDATNSTRSVPPPIAGSTRNINRMDLNLGHLQSSSGDGGKAGGFEQHDVESADHSRTDSRNEGDRLMKRLNLTIASRSKASIFYSTYLRWTGIPSCTDGCPYLKLKIVEETQNHGQSSTSSTSKRSEEQMGVLTAEDGPIKVKVVFTVSCCIHGDQLCIRLRCLRGVVLSYPDRGTVMDETRVAISAIVDDGQSIALSLMDPDDNQTRVRSTGFAMHSFSIGGPAKRPWKAKIGPTVAVPSLGTAGFGEFEISSGNPPYTQICQKDDPLELVTLTLGDSGCEKMDIRKVLVLKRHLVNTLLTGKDRDVDCVDSHAESNAIILTGKLDPGSSTVAITFCAEICIRVIKDDSKEKSIKEIMFGARRVPKSIKLCNRGNVGHLTFEGERHNVENPIS